MCYKIQSVIGQFTIHTDIQFINYSLYTLCHMGLPLYFGQACCMHCLCLSVVVFKQSIHSLTHHFIVFAT